MSAYAVILELVAVALIVAFFLEVWPPGALLVVAAASFALAWRISE